MRPRTFTLAQPPPDGDWVDLPPAEERHARLVLRLRAGEVVTLLDPRGRRAPAVLAEHPGSRRLAARLNGPWTVSPPATGPSLHLAVALIKNASFEVVVQKAVELGATSLRPLKTAHVRPLGAFPEERLHKIAQAAQKQCQRAQPLDLRPPLDWPDFLAGLRGAPDLKVILSPAGPAAESWPTPPANGAVHLAVGPEGGFSAAEESQSREAGFQPLNLGPYILRTETAALAALAIWGYLGRLGERKPN